MLEIVAYAACVLIGVILGILGGGGSILSIPILVYLLQIDVVMASAYSLFIVGATSLVGAIPKYKQHLVNLRTGFFFGIPSIITIFCTRKWVVPAIPEIVLQTESFTLTKRILILGIFAVLMILASISMIRGGAKEIRNNNKRFRVVLVTIEGIIIGFLTGLVGAGGGFLIIPALVLLTGLPFKTAVGTSLFIIAINSLSGFLGDVFTYDIDWIFLLSLTALSIVGILIGNKIAKKIPGRILRKSFGWFILIMGIWILMKETVLSS
jgi:uncharacterized protein